MTGRLTGRHFLQAALLAGTVVCYFFCLKSYGNLPKSDAVTMVLSNSRPSRTRVREILESEEEKGNGGKACFYREEGLITAEDPMYGRQTNVFLVDIQGNAGLLDPRAAGFYEEDLDGCLIDRQTAIELFGSTEAAGREVRILERTFIVRSVIPGRQRMAVIHGDKKEAEYARVFISGSEENQADMASQFLLQYGLTGVRVSGKVLEMVSAAALAFFPLLVVFLLLLVALKQGKKASVPAEALLWKASVVLAAAALVLPGVKGFRIPLEWLPGKWSDFSFWSKRISEEREMTAYFLTVSHTAMETELVYYAVCTVAGSIGAVLCFYTWIIFQKRWKIFKNNDKVVEVSGDSML